MKIVIVYDNYARADLKSAWGFSALIEGEGVPAVLFDTGADSARLFHNMEVLGINPERIGVIVISHAHGDHTGGLWGVLEAAQDAVIYVPVSSGIEVPGRRVVRVDRSAPVADGIFSTGELGGTEQSLVLRTEKGIVVVTGCAHPGVGAILDAAAEFGEVYGIVGGFHGFRNFERFRELSLICPCHCTQFKAEIKALFPEQCVDCDAGLELVF